MHSCFAIMSFMTFAVFTAVGHETEYAKAYLENTSIAVIMFSYLPLGGNSGSRYNCTSSCGPMSFSGMLISSSCSSVVQLRLSVMQAAYCFSQFRTHFGIHGKLYLQRIPGIN